MKGAREGWSRGWEGGRMERRKIGGEDRRK